MPSIDYQLAPRRSLSSNSYPSSTSPHGRKSPSLVMEDIDPGQSPPPSEIASRTSLVLSPASSNALIDVEANRARNVARDVKGPVKMPTEIRKFTAIQDWARVYETKRRNDLWVELYGLFCVLALITVIVVYIAARSLPKEYCDRHYEYWLCSWRYLEEHSHWPKGEVPSL